MDDEPSETAIQRAARVAGGQSALARALEVTPQAVQQWCVAGAAPPERCIAIETAVDGAVTRYDLRPDVFGEAPLDRAAA